MPCSQCIWLCVHVEEWSVFFRVPWRFSIRPRAFFLTAPPHARKRAAVGPLWGSSFAERRNGGSRAAGAALTCGGRRAQLCSLRHGQAPCLARLRALRHCWIRGDKQENGSSMASVCCWERFPVSITDVTCPAQPWQTWASSWLSEGQVLPLGESIKDLLFWNTWACWWCLSTGCRKLKMLTGDKKHFKVWVNRCFYSRIWSAIALKQSE